MGFFDKLKSGVKSVSNAFSKIGAKIKEDILPAVTKAVATVYNDVKWAVSTVYNKGMGLITKTEGDIVGLGNKGLDTVGGLGQSLAMPLIIGGAAVLAFLVMK